MKTEQLEESIKSLEEAIGVSVTIIDYQGTFRGEGSGPSFSYIRQSHRKNSACLHGFCPRCIDHCRHEMNAKCMRDGEAFVESCWKGLTELVIPMKCRGRHLGVFYAGQWRMPDARPAASMPERFYDDFEELELFSERHLQWIPMLRLFVSGLVCRLEELRYESLPSDSMGSSIKSFIMDHADEAVRLEDLAQFLGLSRSRCSYLLAKHFGKGFPALLNEERIRRAEALLEVSELRVAEVAEKVGFTDAYHFNKVFRRINGNAPGRYREQQRKQLT